MIEAVVQNSPWRLLITIQVTLEIQSCGKITAEELSSGNLIARAGYSKGDRDLYVM